MVKNPPANAGDARDGGSALQLGRSLEKGRSTPVFLPGESMGGGAWWATVHGVTKIRTELSVHACTHTHTHTDTHPHES